MIRRGESGGDGWRGPLWSPGMGYDRVPPIGEHRDQDAGDHKGPPLPHSTTLAPTDSDGLFVR